MKRLLLLAGLSLLGYLAYAYLMAPPEPPPPPPVVIEAKPEPVDFAIRSRVRKLFQEWKRRELGDGNGQLGVAAIDPGEEIRQIRQSLFREGRYSESAVAEVVTRSLRELGVAESEISAAASGVMSLQGN